MACSNTSYCFFKNLSWVLTTIIFLLSFSSSLSDPRISQAGIYCGDVKAPLKANYVPSFVKEMESLSQLVATNNWGTHFVNSTIPIYGFAQCLHDLSRTDCLLCYAASRTKLPRCLPSVSARIYLDGCFLRYDNYDFYTEDTDPLRDTVNCSSQFDSVVGEEERLKLSNSVGKVIDNVSGIAVLEGKGFGMGEVEGVYALAQCWKTVGVNLRRTESAWLHVSRKHNGPARCLCWNYSSIRCCNRRNWKKAAIQKNYYEVLGVSADSSAQEIKEAYRRLQKKYHPDITGQEGHEHTLELNKAYEVLMEEDRRRKYDESIGQIRVRFAENGTHLGYSTWNGPLRPQALFVDENACIGCRECMHHARNTFIMDEALGSARVKVQYGDEEQKIEVSVESCPVNCIYWVETEELAVLEFLIQPQPREGYGVFGGGWERPKNVFTAAKSFNQQLKRQAETGHNQRTGGNVEETPAQAEARANAIMKMKMGSFFKIWNWVKETFGMNANQG